MGGRSLKLFVASMLAVALVAAACAKKTTTPPAATGGIDTNAGIVFSLDQEGTNFNTLTSDGNNANVLAIVDGVWPSVYHVDPDVKGFLDKQLMDSVTLASTSPQAGVYKISPNAKR